MFTSLETVKEFMVIKSSSDDALLTRLIKDATAVIVDYLSRDILSAPYTQLIDGNGFDEIILQNYPVTAVTFLSINGVTIPPAADSQTMGYMFDKNGITVKGYNFTIGRKNVVVNYTAGFAAVPEQIEQACIDLVAHKYKEREHIGLDSKGLAGETTVFSTRDMPNRTKLAIAPFRKVDLA